MGSSLLVNDRVWGIAYRLYRKTFKTRGENQIREGVLFRLQVLNEAKLGILSYN
jgi:hypothetical protein